MSTPVDDARFARIAAQCAPTALLLRARPLTGGLSATVTALELALPDGSRRTLVVRQHGAADLARNPRVAAAEYRLLRLLQTEGVLAPAPIWLDESGAILPEPYVVCEYVEGETDFAPADVTGFCDQLAAALARIHCISGDSHDLSFLPARPELLALGSPTSPVLLHGDFWPANVLWRDGQLVAVIDWEDAAVGDPLADIANARLELLLALGEAAMAEFTRHYREHANRRVDHDVPTSALTWTNLPLWDLVTAERVAPEIAGWGLTPAREQLFRDRLVWFTAAARAALQSR